MTIHEYIKYVEKKGESYFELYNKEFDTTYHTQFVVNNDGKWRISFGGGSSMDLDDFEIPKTPGQELDEIIKEGCPGDHVPFFFKGALKIWREKHKDLLDK